VLGIGLDLEAPINFYRLVDRLTWLNVADRRMKSHPLSDFYLYAEDDWQAVDPDSFVVLQTYRSGNTRLLRRRVRPSRYELVIEKTVDFDRPADSMSIPGATAEDVAYSGTRSGLTDRRHRESGGIGWVPDLTPEAVRNSLIALKAMVWMESERNATAQLVVRFERGGSSYSYQTMTVGDVAPRARTWFPAGFAAFVPTEARQGDRVSVYLENRRGRVYVDDLEMRWLRAVWPVPGQSPRTGPNATISDGFPGGFADCSSGVHGILMAPGICWAVRASWSSSAPWPVRGIGWRIRPARITTTRKEIRYAQTDNGFDRTPGRSRTEPDSRSRPGSRTRSGFRRRRRNRRPDRGFR
jgi:hypothetical protein